MPPKKRSSPAALKPKTITDFNALASLSRSTEKVFVNPETQVEVRALTPSENALIRSLTEAIVPPALKRTTPARDSSGNFTTDGATVETIDYDYEDPEYRKALNAAEDKQMLYTVYFGTPALHVSDGLFANEENIDAGIARIEKDLSSNIIDRLYIAIQILTRGGDQAREDFFSDGGSAHFRNSRNSTPSNSVAPSEEPPSTNDGNDTSPSTETTLS